MTSPTATIDLLGVPLTPDELEIVDAYNRLKALVSRDLPPTATANLRDALASVSIVVTGLALDYEQLLDSGC
jgi:hypothetical protein